VATGYDIRKTVLKFTSMNDAPFEGAELNALNALIAEKIESYDLVVVNDFRPRPCWANPPSTCLCRKARFLAVNTQANSGNYGYKRHHALSARRLYLPRHQRSAPGDPREITSDIKPDRVRAAFRAWLRARSS